MGAVAPAPQKAPAGQPVHSAVDAPPAEYEPGAQGFVVPAPCAVRQKNPGGHATCCAAAVAAGQKKPAAHAFDVGRVLVPAAERQTPAAHAVHAAAPEKL